MWLLLLLLLLLSPALAFTVQEPTTAAAVRSEPVERWLDVRLNHFMAHNTETFPMRYYYNQLNDTDENVVIFVGADWEITPDITTEGLAYDIARMLQASVFYTEFRYYGKTRPTQGTSLSELRYLTVDQALGDLAQFIQHIKSDQFEGGKYSAARVVAVGCGLGGSLAAWLRRGYPQLLHAAVADGARLRAADEAPEFLEALTAAILELGGETCVGALYHAIDDMKSALNTTAGLAQVSSAFNTCTPLLPSSALDHTVLFWSIADSLTTMLQAATATHYEAACQVLTDASVSAPMQRLANLVNNPEECLETRYSEVVANYRRDSYDDPHTTAKLAMYQSCVELGSFRTTAGDSAFQHTVPLDFYHQLCKDIFSTDFDAEYISAGAARTNLMFGGQSLPDYVVGVQGALAAWRAAGPGAGHASDNAPVLLVEGATQCNAIGPVDEHSSDALIKARVDVLNYVNTFINGVPFTDAASQPIASVITLVLAAILATAAI